MRISDPFLYVSGLKDNSFLRKFDIRAGDGVITIDGHGFDTIGEFSILTKLQKDMVRVQWWWCTEGRGEASESQ